MKENNTVSLPFGARQHTDHNSMWHIVGPNLSYKPSFAQAQTTSYGYQHIKAVTQLQAERNPHFILDNCCLQTFPRFTAALHLPT